MMMLSEKVVAKKVGVIVDTLMLLLKKYILMNVLSPAYTHVTRIVLDREFFLHPYNPNHRYHGFLKLYAMKISTGPINTKKRIHSLATVLIGSLN